MANTVENIQENIYSDKFDIKMVSNLSLFLFGEKFILLAKDANEEISAIHQKFFADLNSLRFVLERDKLYKLPVKTKVFIFNQQYALVPGLVFDAEQLDKYLYFNAPQIEAQNQIFTALDSKNIYLTATFESELIDILSKEGLETSFYHGSASFLAYVLKDKSSYINQELFINIHGQESYVAAFKNQELVNFNTYETEDKDSLIKYVFGVISQLGLDRKYCRVTVFGDFESLEIDQEFGSLYFKNFILDQPKSNQQYLSGAEIFQSSNLFEAYWEFR
ncbi:DUF3822 family protein [Belliella pelovolcani]|uniref:DUF3822 family protein n=1 Tax=Belliella pelovolcani TaxID=529505 RepID=UPI0039187866